MRKGLWTVAFVLALVTAVAVLTLGGVVAWSDGEEAQEASPDDVQVTVLSCTQTEVPEPVTLAPNRITVELPTGEVRQVKVAMRRIHFRVQATMWCDGVQTEWNGPAVCHELKSADPAYPYTFSE